MQHLEKRDKNTEKHWWNEERSAFIHVNSKLRKSVCASILQLSVTSFHSSSGLTGPTAYHCFLRCRNPLLASDEMVPPSQSCNSTVSNPPDMSRWNPFGEDNFSKLTEEELIDREFDMLRASK